MGTYKKKDNQACSTADTSDSSQADLVMPTHMALYIKQLLSSRFGGLTQHIRTVSSDLATIKEDVKLKRMLNI